jgi:thiamine-monophosphate kinase
MTSAEADQRSRSRGEFDAIARWLDVLPCGDGEGPFRPGDDAAWLSCPVPIAVSVDTVVEDVHFRRSWCTAQDLGWRTLQAALSDLVASRAQPLGCLLSLSVPAEDFASPSWLDEVVAGLGEAARSARCPVLGGDTTASRSGLVIGVTVLGRAASGSTPLGRDGAQQGDLLQVSGFTGWAGLAVERLLEDGGSERLPERAAQAWRRPRARFDLLEALEGASAGIDISDGLLADARHLCEASACSLVLDRASIADPALVEAVGTEAAARLALAGGEDYEILATASEVLPGFRVIGEAVAGHGIHWRDGSNVQLSGAEGWDHGRQG